MDTMMNLPIDDMPCARKSLASENLKSRPSGLRGALQDQRGATMVEMAVVLPAFFLLLFGLFHFSIILFGFSNTTYACRAAARYASLHSSTSLAPSTAASVQSVITPFMIPMNTGVTVTTTWTPSNTIGSTVKVSAVVSYTGSIPFSGLGNITLNVGSSSQRTIMR